MDKTQEGLQTETRKWLEKLEKETRDIRKTGKMKDKLVDPVLENMGAYIKDCRHFISIGDWIRAFEACVYAWGILETLRHLELVK